ncbi:cytochrome b6-f complex iron-sulfur subunit [Algoriphagus boseongensis]|uniref:Cytochrome b6-f complex iron-sulfur subunit n=1 Tax=Algoriphagus boseongensis TaxID=1442587 RepID=A0A4R6TAF1_9BACT|nr:Rieske 2Fe-2S domain-containing protein [Algoriphagus boseongensis]TDQ18595.1 cytochrome b6-f complex iron-sulfur subunit [Algoriphagus boseongensis]
MNEKMNRMEFLKSLGLKGASLVAVYCAGGALTSCINESMAPAGNDGGSTPNLVLDLTSSSYSTLNTVGNYVIVNRIVIARVSQTSFAAVTQVCSHEGKAKVTFRSGEFYCSEHGARFDTSGKGLNSNGSRGLTTYRTELSGTNLTVYYS